MGGQQLENSSGITTSLFTLFVLYIGSGIHLQSPPVISMSEDVVILA